jgi:UDP-N-acetylmuramyl pentapeptide phosphotransferase/UDP-N-acetylglucosamine-1-phosphate transferase
MGDALLVAVATGVLSCSATRALIPVLRRRNILDCPNDRSSHMVPVPRGGGVAAIGSVLLVWLLLAWQGLVAGDVIAVSLGAGLLAIVCWVDDLRGLSPGLRLAAQAAAVAIGVCVLLQPQDPLHGWLWPPAQLAIVGVVWVWAVNLFNFMDGIDGIAGTEAASIGAGLLVFTTFGAGADPILALLCAALLGGSIGFLVWNWSPARIFLGDVGSAPLGYLLGFLLLGLAARGFWKIALILPLYFLADATITLGRRLLRGERVWQAHREHFYQLAVRRGLSHAAVVKRIIAADVVLIGCGWAAENGWGAISLIVAAVTVATLLLALVHGR